MLSDTRQGVLMTLAGGDEAPATLAAALSTRAGRIVSPLNSKELTPASLGFYTEEQNFLYYFPEISFSSTLSSNTNISLLVLKV